MVAALGRQRKLVWHRSCYCSIDSPFGTPRGSFPQIPASPEEAHRIRQDRTRWCDSDTGSRRQVGNMPYLGVGSIIGVEAGPSFCLGKQRNEQTFTVGNSNYRTGRLCSNRVFDAALDSLKCLEP